MQTHTHTAMTFKKYKIDAISYVHGTSILCEWNETCIRFISYPISRMPFSQCSKCRNDCNLSTAFIIERMNIKFPFSFTKEIFNFAMKPQFCQWMSAWNALRFESKALKQLVKLWIVSLFVVISDAAYSNDSN